MARSASNTLTEAENRVMEVLWSRGEASVHDVTNDLSSEKEQAYTTIQTFLGILRDKGWVEYSKKGRAFIYRPLLSKMDAQNSAVKQLIKNVFGGSTEALAQHLLKDSDIDPNEMEILEQAIEKAKQEKDQSNDKS